MSSPLPPKLCCSTKPADAQLKGTLYLSLLGKDVRSCVTGDSERCKHLSCGYADLNAEDSRFCSLRLLCVVLEILRALPAVAGVLEEKALHG